MDLRRIRLAPIKSRIRDRLSDGLDEARLKRSGVELGRVHVVCHTHWDREWYKTVSGFRPQLITLVEGLLDIMEKDPGFRAFHFDGQVAPIDDYLETLPADRRPQQEARLRRLISAGRIQIGPWYTLSDQYLVSGETTLRNLEAGMARARDLGFCLDIGYCPDQFGLIPELPKILNSVGIKRAVGWRGMRADWPDNFRWQSADGSEVDVLNLAHGYSGARPSVHGFRRQKLRLPDQASLWMVGSDHAQPPRKLPTLTRKAKVQFSSLPEYFADLPSFANAPIIRGELRCVGRALLLPNVISNHVDQRIETASAERLLERYAEPLAAFIAPRYPAELLKKAWHGLILNAAHDSACATGIDEVTREVRQRIRETRAAAETVTSQCLNQLSARVGQVGQGIWNPSNFERDFYVQSATPGRSLAAHKVPPLGWAMLSDEVAHPASLSYVPDYRILNEPERGDTYTHESGGTPQASMLPLQIETREGEAFTRMSFRWKNTDPDHRIRLHLKLPQPVGSVVVADTPFGSIARPSVPVPAMASDRLNGSPTGKFLIAGGMAILLDRVAEYEVLPETNEVAITLLRAHGMLSRGDGLRNRPSQAAHLHDRLEDTQILGDIAWDLAVMPWNDASTLPWKEWEQFMLPGLQFTSAGSGDLPARGTFFANLPPGVLSAVLPDKVRVFEETAPHRLVVAPLTPRAPGLDGPTIAA